MVRLFEWEGFVWEEVKWIEIHDERRRRACKKIDSEQSEVTVQIWLGETNSVATIFALKIIRIESGRNLGLVNYTVWFEPS